MNTEYILQNLDSILTKENFIGIGSTRKVYRYNNFVIKIFLHKIGYLQSINELEMSKYLEERNLTKHIAPVLFLNENLMIQPFYEQLPLENDQTYDIDLKEDLRLTKDIQTALNIIDKELDGFDFFDSGNFGLDTDGSLVLIDYGMTKSMYENQWVPLAEEGILPQIYFEKCSVCHIEKGLRMYGKSDTDKRCVACGKE